MAVTICAAPICAAPAAAQPAIPPAADAAAACEAAILRAEHRYRLPHGLLFAMGIAESGRVDLATRRVRPWPWAVQASERSYYFETKTEAVAWVQGAQAGGAASIDTGCLQVNLAYHPQAFANLDAAFDPESNVDYAARFLVRLHDETNDWATAVGFYHSRTATLAVPYQQRVLLAMAAPLPDAAPSLLPAPSAAATLARAWQATSGPSPAPAPARGNSWGSLLAANGGQGAAPPRTGKSAPGPAPVARALPSPLPSPPLARAAPPQRLLTAFSDASPAAARPPPSR